MASGEGASPSESQPCDGGLQLASSSARSRRREPAARAAAAAAAAAVGYDGTNSKPTARNPNGRGRSGVIGKRSSGRSQIQSIWVPVRNRDGLTETGSDGVNGRSSLSSEYSKVVGAGDGGEGKVSGEIQVDGNVFDSVAADVVLERGGGSVRSDLIVESGDSTFALGRKEVVVGVVGLDSATVEHCGGSVGVLPADLSTLSSCDTENAISDVPVKDRRVLRKKRFNKLDRNRNLDVQVNSSYQRMENYAGNSDVVSGSLKGLMDGQSVIARVPRVRLDNGRILDSLDDGGSTDACIGEFSRLGVSMHEEGIRLNRGLAEGDLLSSQQLSLPEPYFDGELKSGLVLSSVIQKGDWLSQNNIVEGGLNEPAGTESVSLKANSPKSSLDEILKIKTKKQRKSQGKVRAPRKSETDAGPSNLKIGIQIEGGEGLMHSNDTRRNGSCIGESSKHAVSGYEQDMRLVRELSEGDSLSSRQADHTEPSVHERSRSSSQHIRTGNEVKRGVRESASLKPDKTNKTKSSLDWENSKRKQPKSLGKVEGAQKHYKNKVKNYAENTDVVSGSLIGLIDAQSAITRVPRVGLDNRRILDNLDDGGRTDACKGEFGKLGVSKYEDGIGLNRGLAECNLLSSLQLGLPEPYFDGELKSGSVLSSAIQKGDRLSQNNIVEGELNEPAGTEFVSFKANSAESSLDEILKIKTKKQRKSQGKVRAPRKSKTQNLDVMQGCCAGPSNLKIGMQKEGGKGLVHSSDTIRNGICIGESSKHAVSGFEQDMRLARELSEGDLLSSRQADHTESSVHERSHSSSQHITIRTGNEVKRGVWESTCLKPDKTKSSLDRGNNKREQPESLGKVKGAQKHSKNKVKEQKLLRKMARREKIEAFLKKLRPDPRGKLMISDYVRMLRRQLSFPVDIDRASVHFTRIYISLLPTEDEKAKRKQLLTLLETLVGNEWPQAKLHVFGSCENSFGIINSDLDVCLSIDDENLDKSAFLLELAAVLKDGYLQNVEAVVRTRVPIVKFMDPSTGISCDISVNNYLPLVNTKLLRDYARLDGRLRQLALIVKHWAKSRGVNNPFNRTLSSYTYVLMCINFLQQREPVILPCLQAMLATYTTTVNGIECAFFDRVDEICHFGSNNESLSQLVWGFFNYWAYHHDYENDVVSVRTGSILSKLSKDQETGKKDQKYTHLVSIEDPLDTNIDLGRVVDCKSIKILREEFERAAQIMQDDPQPWISLFETYVVPPVGSFPLNATPIASS